MNRIITALAVLGACTPATAPAPEHAAPEASAPVAKTPDPEAPPAETQDPPTTPPSAPAGPTFHAAAKVEGIGEGEQAPHFRLFEATGGELFAGAGPQLLRIGSDGSMQSDPTLLEGIETFPGDDPDETTMLVMWDVVTAGGRWPDGFFITITTEFGYRGGGYPNRVYRRDGDHWTEVASKGNHFRAFPTDLAPWKDESVLALRGFEPIYTYPPNRDETTEPTRASVHQAEAAIARQKPLVVVRGVPRAPKLGRRDIAAIDALPSGEIIGVVEGEKPIAVHFDPETGGVTERPLAAKNLADANVIIEGPARAWIYGRAADESAGDHPVEGAFLARFDGEHWIGQPAPSCHETGIGSYSRSPEGDAWATCGSPPDIPLFDRDGYRLWYRPAKGDRWSLVSLPEDAVPMEVVARGSDDVWVAGSGLFHTRPHAEVVTIPGYAGQWADIRENQPAVATFSCHSGTVLLDGSPEGDHEDLVAAMAKAFDGSDGSVYVELVEVPFRGEPHLALQYRSPPKGRLATRIRQALGGHIGETHCVIREPTRELGSWP